MNASTKTLRLNPRPRTGDRQIGQRAAGFTQAATITRAAAIRLSLSQRERMKVRDCFCGVPPKQAKLLAERCRVLCESGDSKIAVRQFRGAQGTRHGHDRALDWFCNCVRRHLARSPTSRQGNRNRVRKNRADAGGETCNLRSSGSADVAKECTRIQLRSFEANERGAQRTQFRSNSFSQGGNLLVSPSHQPLTSILSPQPGRGGQLVASLGTRGNARAHRLKTYAYDSIHAREQSLSLLEQEDMGKD
jgi:hypothetical protein